MMTRLWIFIFYPCLDSIFLVIIMTITKLTIIIIIIITEHIAFDILKLALV